ncbi:MAG: hypothetical protein KAR21_15810 [Spirochaetales bacterium]|nr:hypothetical protein [Spirochaetales bacterium]
MKKKRILIALVLFLVISGVVWAQSGDKGKKGLLFEWPLSDSQKTIGFVYYLDDTTVLKPFVNIYLDFDSDWDELAGTAKDNDSTFYIEPGIAYDKILSSNGPLSFYAGAAVSVMFNLWKDEPAGGNVTELSYFGVRISPRVGTQYMFTNNFGIYGNLQISALYRSDKDTLTDPGGTLLADVRDTSLTIETVESALGVVFFFE